MSNYPQYTKRSIAFIAIPSFPIAVERALNRSLEGRPTVVAQSANSRSRCLSVSSEARLFGIRTGMSISDARRCSRDLHLLPLNPPLYSRALEAIKRIINDFTPVSEPAHSGQIYLDLTGTKRLFGSAQDVTATIRARLLREFRLPADVGLSINKLVSRIAALDSKPEGLYRVRDGWERAFLGPHRVGMLPSTDHKSREILNELNISLVKQVRTIDVDQLLKAVGILAFTLKRHSLAIDPEPVTPPEAKPCIVQVEELDTDNSDFELLCSLVQRLTVEGLFRLRQTKHTTGEIILSLYYADGKVSRGLKRLKNQTETAHILLKQTDTLFRRTFTRRIRVRRIELIFNRLGGRMSQLDLWNSPPFTMTTDGHMRNTESRLQTENVLPGLNGNIENHNQNIPPKLDFAIEAIERIRDRYGDSALKIGMAA